MHKKWIFGFSPLFVSSVVFSQTVDPKIDRIHRDPQTAERAAKADVLIQNKNTVTYNSTVINKDKKAACTKTKKKKYARTSHK
jgi:hypothetical protein